MGVQFIRRPISGELPFINADGNDIVEVMRTLKRFGSIANGGDVADSVHLNPVQIQAIEAHGLSITQVIEGPELSDEEHARFLTHLPEKTLDGLKIIPDTEVLPTGGVLYKGDKPLATIRNLSIPFTSAAIDEVASTNAEKEIHAQLLHDEATNLRSIADSLEARAKRIT